VHTNPAGYGPGHLYNNLCQESGNSSVVEDALSPPLVTDVLAVPTERTKSS